MHGSQEVRDDVGSCKPYAAQVESEGTGIELISKIQKSFEKEAYQNGHHHAQGKENPGRIAMGQ